MLNSDLSLFELSTGSYEIVLASGFYAFNRVHMLYVRDGR